TLTSNLNNEINRAQNAESSTLASAKSYADSRTPWPQTCADGQIIQRKNNAWVCADPPVAGATSGFPNSTIANSTQGAQINTWAGTANQLWKLCYSRNVDGA